MTKSGQLLFTAQDVIEGKILAQKYGLLDYGSFLGFGGYLMHKYTEPAELYGINNILPFNVARGLHYNLAVLWIAVS